VSRRWFAVPLTLAALLAGCSDETEEGGVGAKPEDAGNPPAALEPFTEPLGCESWTPAVSDGDLGSAMGYACVVGDAEVAWVHVFPPSERELHFQHLSRRSVDAGVEDVVCADGEPPSGVGPWILVGDDWATSSYHEDLVAQVADALGGDYAGGGGEGEAPPLGPPVSFQVPDFCADG